MKSKPRASTRIYLLSLAICIPGVFVDLYRLSTDAKVIWITSIVMSTAIASILRYTGE